MNTSIKFLTVAVACFLSQGCEKASNGALQESSKTAALTASTLGQQTILSAAGYLAQERFANADQKNGQGQAQICRACHSLDAGGPNMIGPGLSGFFGRKVGEREGFEYSAAIMEADFVWTPRALNAWLSQPGRFLPGNRMTFAGVMRQSDRDDLIAYLLATTASGPNSD